MGFLMMQIRFHRLSAGCGKAGWSAAAQPARGFPASEAAARAPPSHPPKSHQKLIDFIFVTNHDVFANEMNR